jgi:hypothetical protein
MKGILVFFLVLGLAGPAIGSELYPTIEEQRRFEELQKPYVKQMESEIQAIKVKQQEMDRRLHEIEMERFRNQVEDSRHSHSSPVKAE